jgi:electron transfer flavoprotein alpha/beta subunit
VFLSPSPHPPRLPLFLGAQLKVKQLTGVEGIDEVSRAAEGIRDVQHKIDTLRASHPQH